MYLLIYMMWSVRFLTCSTFKKAQLDHVIEIILEAGGDPDHPARRIADEYPASNVGRILIRFQVDQDM